MRKKFRCIVAFMLTLCMVVGMMATTAFAEDTANVWHGDDISVDVKAGKDGYNFLSVYTSSPKYAYEMSNHMVSADGGALNEIPQTLVMVDASKDYTWTPSGIYSFGASNYEVMYCCDVETPYVDGIYYKRLNLEDSNYYNEEAAAHIRAIVTNSYPYVSLEQMKANLAAEGFADADKLTRAEIITAVQTAVWAYANGATDYRYSHTFDVPSNSQWGRPLYDFTNEMEVWWSTGKRQFSTDETVAARINALAEYLKGLNAVYAEKNQIIISDIEIVDFAPVMEKDGVYKVALRVALNNSGSSEMDELYLTAAVDGTVVKTEKVALGTEVYEMTIEAEAGQTIEAVVSGSQILPLGAYFYEPEGGREVSQSLVGVVQGENEVYAAASTVLEVEADPVSGNVVLQKVDEDNAPLTGAEFSLYVLGEGEALYVDTYAVDENGVLVVENLLPGKYELVETKVPEGYADPMEAIQFEMVVDGEELALELLEAPAGTTYEEDTLTVINFMDEVLGDSEGPDPGDEVLGDNDSPTTGNNMSVWFAFAAVSAMAMAGMTLVRRKEER